MIRSLFSAASSATASTSSSEIPLNVFGSYSPHRSLSQRREAKLVKTAVHLKLTGADAGSHNEEDGVLNEQEDLAMKVATFRFGVIADFVTGVRLGYGE